MWFDRDLSKPFMHTGFAPPRATVCAAEEIAHGLREIPQCLLLHRLTPARSQAYSARASVNCAHCST
jgi:hypothetical protein